MKIDEVLQAACESVRLPVYPGSYDGGAVEYLVWNYTEIPVVFADSAPHAARYLVQVHHYLPHKQSPYATKISLSWALFRAGFTWPSITPANDAEGQHYVFECEFTDGGGYYAQN